MFRFFSCASLTLVFLCPAVALDVNQASEAELDGLRGIGPPFTRRLKAAHAQQPFQDCTDLMQRVSGMGPRVAQSLSDQGLTVQSQSLPCPLREEKSSALKLAMPQKPCAP